MVTIEEFAVGDFQKYVNNDCTLSSNEDTEKQMKAESLVHFSYIKSKKKVLLVDIQGAKQILKLQQLLVVLMRNNISYFVLETFQRQHT